MEQSAPTGATEARVPKAIVHLLDNFDEPIHSHPICSDRITMGRQGSCDVRIEGKAVSKLHVTIDVLSHTIVVHSANAVQVQSPDGRAQMLRRDEGALQLYDSSRLVIAGRHFVYEICHQLDDDLSDQSIDMAVVQCAIVDTPAQSTHSLRRSPRHSNSAADMPLPDDSFDRPTGVFADITVPLASADDSDEEGGSSSDIPPPMSGNETSDEEVESLLVSPQVAASVPLPDSPPNSSPVLDQRIPSSAPTRRLSLRERLLVRSAISAHMSRSTSQEGISAPPPSPSPASGRQPEQLMDEPEPVSVFEHDPIEEVPIMMADEPQADVLDTPMDEEAFADAPEQDVQPAQMEPSPSPPRHAEPVIAAATAVVTPVRPRRSARLSAENRPSPGPSPSPPQEQDRRFKHSRLTPRKSSLKTPGSTPQPSPDEERKSVKKSLKRKVSFHETIAMVEIPHRTESEAEIFSPVKRPRIESSGPLTDKSGVEQPTSSEDVAVPVPSTSVLPGPEPPKVQLPSDLLFSPGKQDEVSDMLDSLSKPSRTPSRARRSPTKQPPLVVQQALIDMQSDSLQVQRSLPPPRRSPAKPLAELLKSPAPKLGSRPLPSAQPPATVQAPRTAKLLATLGSLKTRRSSLPSEQAAASAATGASASDVFAAPSTTTFAPRLPGMPKFSFFPTPVKPAAESQPVSFSPDVFTASTVVRETEPEPIPLPIPSSSPTRPATLDPPEPIKASRATLGKSSAIPKARRAVSNASVNETPAPTTTAAAPRRTTRATRSATAASTEASTTRAAASRAVKTTAGRKTTTSTSTAKAKAALDSSPTTAAARKVTSRSDKENDGDGLVIAPAPAVSRSGRPLRSRTTTRA